LDEDVFDEIGKSVTLTTVTAPIYNERGDLEDSTNVDTIIIVVPWDLTDNLSNQIFGNFIEGSSAMVIRYDQAITHDDLIVMEGITYQVRDINPNYLPDNVATILRLVRNESVTADD